jgi:methionyl-tRNA formyltransferase
MDDGPVIAQAAVPVLVGDSEEELTARVLKAEHRLYPQALKLVAEGKARMEGGRTVFSGFADDSEKAALLITAPSPLEGSVDLEQLARITP